MFIHWCEFIGVPQMSFPHWQRKNSFRTHTVFLSSVSVWYNYTLRELHPIYTRMSIGQMSRIQFWFFTRENTFKEKEKFQSNIRKLKFTKNAHLFFSPYAGNWLQFYSSTYASHTLLMFDTLLVFHSWTAVHQVWSVQSRKVFPWRLHREHYDQVIHKFSEFIFWK